MMTDIEESDVLKIQSNQSQNDDTEPTVIGDFTKATELLSEGFLAIYQPPLQQIKKELNDLTLKQESLITRMQVENKKLSEVQEDVDLNDLFLTVKIYKIKLANIKKEMVSIHERSTKLKKRALRLQQIKQRDIISKEHQREPEVK